MKLSWMTMTFIFKKLFFLRLRQKFENHKSRKRCLVLRAVWSLGSGSGITYSSVLWNSLHSVKSPWLYFCHPISVCVRLEKHLVNWIFSKDVHSWYLHRKCDCRNKNICCIIVHRHTAKAEMRSFPHKEWENVCLQDSQQHPYLRLLSWFESIKCWNNTINELPRAATTDKVLSLLLSFFHSHISEVMPFPEPPIRTKSEPHR